MEQIICIILIFFLLGLLLRHFLPLIEGNASADSVKCTNNYKWSVEGENGELTPDSEQGKYNTLKEEYYELQNQPECQSKLLDKNSSLIKSFKDKLRKNVQKSFDNIAPLETKLTEAEIKWDNMLELLYKQAYPEENNEEQSEEVSTSVGKIDGVEVAHVDGGVDKRVGGDIDTSGIDI